MKAIVIDDSRAMRGILKRVLTGMNFELQEAVDGLDALTKLTGKPSPDLALVDWNMPNMNGLEFITAIRKDTGFNEMRIVMVTTEVEMHQIEKALLAGANEYVMKPFTEDVMREKIQMLGLAEAA